MVQTIKKVKKIIYYSNKKIKNHEISIYNGYRVANAAMACFFFMFYVFFLPQCTSVVTMYGEQADRISGRALVKGTPSFGEMREKRIIKCLSEIRYGQRSNYRKVIELFGLFAFSFPLFCLPSRVTGVWKRQLYSIIAWPKCFSEYSETHRLVYLINHAASLISNVKFRPRLRRAFFERVQREMQICS